MPRAKRIGVALAMLSTFGCTKAKKDSDPPDPPGKSLPICADIRAALPTGPDVVRVDDGDTLDLATLSTDALLTDGHIVVRGTGRVVLDGNRGTLRMRKTLWLLDDSTLEIERADLDVNQRWNGEHRLYLFDRSTVRVRNSTITAGDIFDNAAWFQFVCDDARAEFDGNNFAPGDYEDPDDRVNGAAQVLVYGRGTYVARENEGLFELNVSENGTGEVVNQPAGLYFGIEGRIRQPIRFPRGPQSRDFEATVDSELRGVARIRVREPKERTYFFGAYVNPHAQVEFVDSYLALFLNYGGAGEVPKLAPGKYADKTFTFGTNDTRRVQLTNSEVWVWNVYQSADVPGELAIDDAVLGEHTCRGVEGTVCRLDGTAVDGSGGIVSVEGSAWLIGDGARLSTETTAAETSRISLYASRFTGGEARPTPTLRASGSARIDLVATHVGPEVEFDALEEGAIVTASITSPAEDATVESPVRFEGIAMSMGSAGSPHAFASSTLEVRVVDTCDGQPCLGEVVYERRLTAPVGADPRTPGILLEEWTPEDPGWYAATLTVTTVTDERTDAEPIAAVRIFEVAP